MSLNDCYWGRVRGRQVVILAAPFGYGPRTAGSELCRRLGFSLSPWAHSSINDVAKIANRAHLVFNFGVEPIKIKSPSVWIDCLRWARAARPAGVEEALLDMVEVFFPERKGGAGGNTRWVAPLTQAVTTPSMLPARGVGAARKRIMISFGGLETPYSEPFHTSLWPSLVLEALRRATPEYSNLELLVAGPGQILGPLVGRLNSPKVKCEFLPHRLFLSRLCQADLVFLQPGLYGPFEAFERSVPTALLPPTSYTQLLQAREYARVGLLGEVPFAQDLFDLGAGIKGDVCVEEREVFGRLSNWISVRRSEKSTVGILEAWFHNQMTGAEADGLLQQRRQHARSCRRVGTCLRELRALIGRTAG